MTRKKAKLEKEIKTLKEETANANAKAKVTKKPFDDAGARTILEPELKEKLSKVTAVANEVLEDGKKIRVFKSNGEAVEA